MSQKEGGACGVLTQRTGINIITRREVHPSLSNLTKFWSSQENKQNLQLLVRDTLCNGHFVNTTIIARYVVSNNEMLPPEANSGERDPRIIEMDRGRRQQDSAVSQLARQPFANQNPTVGLMLAQQQHIWLGQRYFARWIHVGPTLNRQHSANHEPTFCQP